METVQKVAKNTGVIIFGNIINSFISIATVIYLTRYLGAGGFGTYSFIFVYLGFFNIIVDLGISRILVRDISRDRSRADILIGNSVILRIILSILAIILACLIINFIHYPFNIKLLVCVASLGFLLSINGLYTLIFQANLKMEYPTVVDTFNNLVKFGAFILLIYLKAPLFWFIFATIACGLPGLIAIIFISGRFIRLRFALDLGIWKGLIRESWPIALTTTFIMVYLRIDQLMLFNMKGASSLGYYSAAVKLTEVFNVIPLAFTASIFPLFSRYFISSGQKLEDAYKVSFKYMSSLIIPIAVGTFILSGSIIRIIYGEQFMQARSALQILIFSEIFVFLGSVHINILVSVGLQKLDLIFTSLGAVTNVILNLLLIPRYGIAGASVATLISYSLGLPLSCAISKTRKYGQAMAYSVVKPIAAALAMGCFTYFSYMRGFPLAVIIFASAVIYFTVLILFRGLDRRDLGYFKTILAVK